MRTIRIILCLLITFVAAGCRDSEKSARAPASQTIEQPAPEPVPDERAVREGPVPTRIDPAKAAKLTTGHEAERLLAKYELLVERIRKERKEKVFNNIRMIVNGLKPIASEHHELYDAGKIDSVTHDSFVKLGVFMMSHHIMAEQDPLGFQARVLGDSIRAKIRRGPEGTPAAPDSAPPR